MIGIIDYGAGNLRSVGNALDHIGVDWSLCSGPEDLAGAERLILPGVGHFGTAMQELDRRDLREPLQAAAARRVPLLGICLGAQMFFEHSTEAPGVPGLALLPGTVQRLTTATVPHMGWNRVRPVNDNPLLPPGDGEAYFYFAHSFVCVPADPAVVAAVAECDGQELCVAVRQDNLYGVQFHPEKSAAAGLEMLRRFATC